MEKPMEKPMEQLHENHGTLERLAETYSEIEVTKFDKVIKYHKIAMPFDIEVTSVPIQREHPISGAHLYDLGSGRRPTQDTNAISVYHFSVVVTI